MSLPKHRHHNQFELFDRAEVPAHIPRMEAFAATARRSEARTSRKPVAWVSMATWARTLGRFEAVMQSAAEHHRRYDETARTLTVERIRECRHLDDLERVEAMLTRARYQDICSRLARAWPRRELGALIVEARNRIQLLRMGRTEPKPKGPRFDPTRIPDGKLDALIQRHPDLAVVELLRAERQRRAELA